MTERPEQKMHWESGRNFWLTQKTFDFKLIVIDTYENGVAEQNDDNDGSDFN